MSEMEALLPYCSPSEARYIRAVIEQGSQRRAAGALGINQRTIERGIRAARFKAENSARRGYMPDHGLHHPLPPGMHLERATIQRNGDGAIERTWAKPKADKERQIEVLLEKLEAGDTGFSPFKPVKAPVKCDSSLLSLLTITDFHIGAYAWSDETGDDWDVSIAREVFLNAVHDMCQSCPKSGLGLLNQLGDFLHFDSLLAVTPSSGHVLDADTRYGKLVDLTMDIMAEAVRIMLRRFERVHVVQAEGNHDIAGSVWLRKFIKHMFSNEPRVTVDDTEFPYYAYLHGETMLGFHHGHKLKLAQLQKLFSSEPRYRAMWGKAKQAYIHTGHLHHERVMEDGGAIIEQHPTLAGRDAYAARGGWVSMRGAKVITYDTHDGEVHRVTVRPRHG